jgi:uncharacterized protein
MSHIEKIDNECNLLMSIETIKSFNQLRLYEITSKSVFTMKGIPNYADCINILLIHSVPSQVIDHSVCTTQTAFMVVKRLKKIFLSIDCQLILAGSMLHDIGRCKSHDIDHGILGAKLLRYQGFSEKLARIAETHLFAGIAKSEAYELGLPSRDYLPLSLEEKIIAYSDNISKGGILLTTNQVIRRFSNYLSPFHPIILRVKQLHEEFDKLLETI